LTVALETGGAGLASAEARATALLVLSALYGALIMARAVGDSPLSREVLQSVRMQLSNLTGPGPVKKARLPKQKMTNPRR
jgi:hypothetical protein